MPLHEAVWQVWTGHVPQLTVSPQLFAMLPHLPAQVWAWVWGVQHPLPMQTCPVEQQTPLQQPGAGHPVCAPFVALAVLQRPPAQVATVQIGGAGQEVAFVPQHC